MQRLSQVFEKYLYWWALILFVFIPLYPKFPFINMPGTYVAIRAEDFLIALVLFWWFIAVAPRIKKLLADPITQSFLLFWGVGLLSLFSGIYLTQTTNPGLGSLHYLRRIEVMGLFFITATAFKKIKQIKILLTVMLFATLIIDIYGFGQQWLHFPVISTTNREFSKGLILTLTPDARVNSTFAGHYDLAAFQVLFLTVATGMFLYLKSLIKKLVIVLVSILSFIILALTAARLSFVAAILGIGLVLWMTGNKKLILFMMVLSLLAFVISPELRNRTIATVTVTMLNQSGPRYSPPPQKVNSNKAFSLENAATGSASLSALPRDIAPGEPLNTTELGVYRSSGIRFNEEWPRAIRAFIKNPFLGTGHASLSIATDNDYLRSLGETGLLGFFALALVFVSILIKIVKNINKDKSFNTFLLSGVFAAVIALLINASFIDVLESSKIASLMWLSLGLAYAVTKM